MVSQMACSKKLGEPFMAHLEIRHYTVHYLSAKLSYKLPSERSPVSAFTSQRLGGCIAIVPRHAQGVHVF